jgi:hypothetical protein
MADIIGVLEEAFRPERLEAVRVRFAHLAEAPV